MSGSSPSSSSPYGNRSFYSSAFPLFCAAALGVVVTLIPAAAFALGGKRSRRYLNCLTSTSSSSSSSTGGGGGAGPGNPPRLPKRPTEISFGAVPGPVRGGDNDVLMSPILTREDPYYWIRDDSRKNEEVLQHLTAENAYYDEMVKPLQPLKKQLFKEFLAHMKETDQRAPYPRGKWYYYSKNEEGQSYPIYCRKASMESKEEIVLLNVNDVAKGKTFCDVGDIEPSEDHEVLAYSVDFSGYETYDIHFKDLTTSSPLPDIIHDVAGMTWGTDRSTLYYLTHDDEHRPNKLWRHEMGKTQADDVMLYEEKDKRFSLGTCLSSDSSYLLLETSSSMTSEVHVINLKSVKGYQQHASKEMKCFQKRIFNLKYDIDHHDDSSSWFIITNKDNAINQKVMTCTDANTSATAWKEYFKYDENTYLKGLHVFKDFVVVSGRQGGFSQLFMFRPKDETNKKLEKIEWDDAVHSVGLGPNYNYDTTTLRISYGTFTTPQQTLDYNVNTKTSILLKEQPSPNYNRSDYSSLRLECKSVSDNSTVIPLSCVYSTKVYPDGLPKTSSIPIYLYGYGSYGISMNPSFDYKRISMLDRGVVYIQAHIRGGADMGRGWYEQQGKFLNKKNTFLDFISCAEYLIKEKYTAASKICICGRSAGGLLVGASINLRPDLFKAAIADVPFVDVLTTMRDSTIPLTAGEWEEWGNPNCAEYYYYMLEYSPYDNIRATRYPAMYISAGLFDSRVAYWEPTKWVAKLRDMKTDNHPVLLKMEMDCGHFSASDRYKNMREMAEEMSWALHQIGAEKLLVEGPPVATDDEIKEKLYKK